MSGSQNQDESKEVLRGYQPVTTQILSLLNENNVAFEVLEHKPVFTSQEAAEVRQTLPEQGAKALIVKASDEFTMLVLRGDQRTQNSKVRQLLKSKHLRFANKEELFEITGCLPGSVPPFGQLFGLRVLLDEGLTAFDEVAFNAGSHTVSLKMSCEELVKLSNAEVVSIC
jgi:Ala-tRNA(Pro) deacylase